MDILFTLRFAEQLARNVGEYIRESQSKVKIEKYKDAHDMSTNIDIEAERKIIAKIKTIYPNHSFFTEEMGTKKTDSEYEWVIDPIDGTKEYVRGLPQYNTCFSLEKSGETILSVVYEPSIKKLYSSASDIGVFEDGIPKKPSSIGKVEDAFIYAYLPNSTQSKEQTKKSWDDLYKILIATYRLRSIAEEVVAMCWVATGKIDAFINLNSNAKWWDIAPGFHIAKCSAAKITDKLGKPVDKQNHQNYIVSNGKVHDELLELIKNHEK